MISINTDDGEMFTITVEGADFQVPRSELAAFLELARHMLDVTRQLVIEPDEEAIDTSPHL